MYPLEWSGNISGHVSGFSKKRVDGGPAAQIFEADTPLEPARL